MNNIIDMAKIRAPVVPRLRPAKTSRLPLDSRQDSTIDKIRGITYRTPYSHVMYNFCGAT